MCSSSGVCVLSSSSDEREQRNLWGFGHGENELNASVLVPGERGCVDTAAGVCLRFCWQLHVGAVTQSRGVSSAVCDVKTGPGAPEHQSSAVELQRTLRRKPIAPGADFRPSRPGRGQSGAPPSVNEDAPEISCSRNTHALPKYNPFMKLKAACRAKTAQ